MASWGVTLLLLVMLAAGCGSTSPSSHSSAATSSAAPATSSGAASVAATTSAASSHSKKRSGHKRSKPAFGHARTHSTPTSRAELRKFEQRAALAFAIFHQHVYQPLVTGHLRTRAERVQAAHAATQSMREVLAAKQEATGGTAVREQFAPLAAVAALLGQAAVKLGHGHADTADLKAADRSIAAIEKAAAAAGLKIVERPGTAVS